jgi:hypothetical protein
VWQPILTRTSKLAGGTELRMIRQYLIRSLRRFAGTVTVSNLEQHLRSIVLHSSCDKHGN